MTDPAERAELICRGGRGAGWVQECVLGEPEMRCWPGLSGPAVVSAFGILVLPHAIADACAHQGDDLGPVEHDLQVSPPRERAEQLHSGLGGTEQGSELDFDVARVDRLIAGRLRLVHGRKALQNGVSLVGFYRCLRYYVEFDPV